MSTALTVLRQELIRQLGLGMLIPNGDITAIGASSITAGNSLRNSLAGATLYSDQKTGIHRPGAASTADTFRFAGDLTNSTGALAITGLAYVDQTIGSEAIELLYWGVRPDRELLDSLNRVLEFEFLTTRFAISHLSGLDGDMALSTDTNWTDVGTTSTSAKASTSGVTPEGQRAYHTINNAVANSGTRSASYRVRQSGNMSGFTIASSEVGTSSLQPYDNTNSVVFGTITAVTSSEREPQLLVVRGQVPSTCKLMSLNLTNTSATGDTYWNQAWLYNHDDLTCLLPAAVTESFMAPRIVQCIPRVSSGTTGAYAARSFDYVPLTEGVDYWLQINHADAEPYKVRFESARCYEWPLMVEAKVAQSSLITLSAEGDVVNVAKHNVLPRWKLDVLNTIYNGAAAPRHPDWTAQVALAQSQLISALQARPMESMARARPYYRGASRL